MQDPTSLLSDQGLTLATQNPDDVQNAETLCKGLFPAAQSMNLVAANMSDGPLSSPQCFSGSLGEMALAVQGASTDVETANAQLQVVTDQYNIALNDCIIQEGALAQEQQVKEATEKISTAVKQVQEAANQTLDMVKGGIGCAIGLATDTEETCIDSAVDAVESGVEGVTEQSLSTDALTSLSNDFVASIKEEATNAECFNDAQMKLVGASVQATQIQKAQVDLSSAMVKMRNAQATFPQLVAEGNDRIAAEQQRTTTSLVNDTWKDLWSLDSLDDAHGAIEQARADLHVAQRATYLAVRAVEYDWQMTLAARSDVLRARQPSDLQQVLNDLQVALAPNNIAGQMPKNEDVVVSLKDHVLQLASMRSWPAGSKTWSDTERLRYLLTSPRFADYDSSGNYLGQLIPFGLAPLGVMGIGQSAGIPLLTGSDCAERLWKVNIVLEGTGIMDGTSTQTRVDMLQQNVFQSQWCTEQLPGVSPLQKLSVNPALNLFQDPQWGAVGGTSAVTGEADLFLRAAVDAYLNVSQADFEAASYDQGSSIELACRGLYGNYALFFSAPTLALPGQTGLHLENIDDVLLRFDYVSVSKAW